MRREGRNSSQGRATESTSAGFRFLAKGKDTGTEGTGNEPGVARVTEEFRGTGC